MGDEIVFKPSAFPSRNEDMAFPERMSAWYGIIEAGRYMKLGDVTWGLVDKAVRNETQAEWQQRCRNLAGSRAHWLVFPYGKSYLVNLPFDDKELFRHWCPDAVWNEAAGRWQVAPEDLRQLSWLTGRELLNVES